MQLDMQLPACPICKAPLVMYQHKPGPKQTVHFNCGAHYEREASPEFKDPDKLRNYGPWSAWKCTDQCGRATEVALALLSKQGSG